MRSASYSRVHTAGNAVPPVGGELAGLLEDLSGIHAGVDLIRAGVRLLATERLTRDETQTVLAALGGADGTDVVGLICALVARLVDADVNPALRDLDLAVQANLRRMGEAVVVDAATSFPRDLVAETCARIDPYAQFDDDTEDADDDDDGSFEATVAAYERTDHAEYLDVMNGLDPDAQP